MKRYLKGVPKSIQSLTTSELTEYLKNHFRYFTMHSWNVSTSYAQCVKFRELDLTTDEINACYDMLQVKEAWDEVTAILRRFNERWEQRWQIGFNGRSSGYLVLYMGGVEANRAFCWPGKSVDQGADFSSWEPEDIASRAQLVWDFDNTCERAVQAFVRFAVGHTVAEEIVMVPKRIQVAKPKGKRQKV